MALLLVLEFLGVFCFLFLFSFLFLAFFFVASLLFFFRCCFMFIYNLASLGRAIVPHSSYSPNDE